ncbi:MAG: hypothetical protein GY821_02395, partial [Gammaproteobacteria bacterium]|nr:hypothetical protein [Gammaproteobacteria bacterium]
MAWIITAVGSMAASSGVAFTIGNVAVTNLGLMATAAGVGARALSNSAKQQEIDYKMQADQEKLAAESQHLDRTQKLNRALAANAVGIADSGMSGEGTPAS